MRIIILISISLYTFLSFSQSNSDEYIKKRGVAIEKMLSDYGKSLYKSPEYAIKVLDTSLPSYKDDNVVLTWKYKIKGNHYGYIGNKDSAIFFFKKCFETLDPQDDLYLYSLAKAGFVNFYCVNFQLEEARIELEGLKKQVDSNSSNKVKLEFYGASSTYYQFAIENDRSIEYSLKAIELLESIEDPNLTYQLKEYYQQIGHLMKGESAANYYRKARDLAKYEITRHNINGYIVRAMRGNSTDEEIKDIRKAVFYFDSVGLDMEALACKSTLATALFEKGEIKESELVFLQGYKLSHTNNDVREMIRSSFGLGRLYEETGQHDKSIKYYLESMELGSTIKNFKSLQAILKGLSNVYKNKKDYKKANFYLEKYFVCQEKSKFEERQKVMFNLEQKYQSEKKEQEIELLKAKNELDTQQQLSQKRTLIGVTVLIGLAGIFFFFLYRNKQKTNTKLQEVDLIKTRFFENISHEFRTPLTLIKLPLSKSLKTDEPLTIKQTTSLHNNASRLQNLVEDLLSLSELDAGKMIVNKSENRPFKQSRILCSQFDSYASSKGITYTKIVEDKHILASYDSTVIDKVLTNLISNAIKYSNPGDSVEVSISYQADDFKIEVKDTGMGISEENQQKIFDRFYQIGDKDEEIQGSGIGLALVKRILELNQGSIEVQSKLNKGSLFTAILPLEKVREVTLVEPEEYFKEVIESAKIEKEDLVGQIDLENKSQLLIVEDNQELLEYIAGLFQNEFHIITAKNGKEGLEKAIESVPDFIISDWMMPKMNGIDFCEQIKTNSITSHIPFLLLTAKSDVKNKIKGYETGADAYFSKPFNADELKAQINNLINQRKVLLEKYSEGNIPSSVSANTHDAKFWDEFKNYLRENISEADLSTETIAKQLFLSRMQLHRKITALTGQTVSELIRNQRMNLAVKLLKESDLRISEICFEVGYYDNSSFTRTFKKEFGVTPTQYKNNINK